MGEKRLRNKGAMGLSFGMIFSIILIIVFITFAFYAVKTFLGIQETAKIAKFRENLQEDVNKVWRSTQASQQVSYNLPSKIRNVCFKKDGYENLFFKPADAVNLAPINITNIDMEKTIPSGRRELCFENKNSKVIMLLKKDFGETLVTITNS